MSFVDTESTRRIHPDYVEDPEDPPVNILSTRVFYVSNLVASLVPPTPDFPDLYYFLNFLGQFWAPGGVPAARPQNSASDGLRESPR